MFSTTQVAGFKPHGVSRPRAAVLVTNSSRFNVNFAVFSDNEGPYSGKRHPPIPSEPRLPSQPPGPAEHFDLLSAEEMESKFPEWIHASTPPAITDKEPPGLTALKTPDAGPRSGHRRFVFKLYFLALLLKSPSLFIVFIHLISISIRLQAS
jgi:hypothetical protein